MAAKQNLGEGSIPKLMFQLALPTVISQVVNMLYNVVDRMYIGQIPETGAMALTGLGLCFPIIMLVSAFSALFGMGGAPLAAIQMGMNNDDKAQEILCKCATCLMLVALTLTTILLFFGENLLYMFGASGNTIGYAMEYLSIYAIGTIFVQITLGLNPFITTQGFAKFSMLTVLIGAITNIVLDPIFIFGLNMGVQGAALATTIAQALSAIWVIRFLTGKRTKLKLQRSGMGLSREIMLPVIALGLSPFTMQATESVLNVCFNVSLFKYGGDLAVGTMTIVGSVMTLCYMPLQGLTQGAQPLISFNFGAGKMDRVRATIKIQIAVCFTATTICWAMAMLFPQVFVRIFNNDPELMAMAVWATRIYMAGMFMFGLQLSCQQSFVALGYAKVSFLLACLRKIILLIPLIFILPNFFDDKVFAVFLAEPVADILAAITTVTVFSIIARRDLVDKPISINH